MPISIRSTQNASDTLKGKSSYANEPDTVGGFFKNYQKNRFQIKKHRTII